MLLHYLLRCVNYKAITSRIKQLTFHENKNLFFASYERVCISGTCRDKLDASKNSMVSFKFVSTKCLYFAHCLVVLSEEF